MERAEAEHEPVESTTQLVDSGVRPSRRGRVRGVSVLPLAIVRLLNTRMSTGGPPDCATPATTVGAAPVHEPVVNEWDVEL